MSKIGKKPITIPDGIDVKINGTDLEFKGKEGELKIRMLPYINIEIKDNKIFFTPRNNSKQARANWGTMRALSQNAINGLSGGFEKSLEIQGVGYRAEIKENNLLLFVGLSHPVKIIPPEGVKISIGKNIIKVSGIDKSLVGRIAAQIRAVKKPEPYKGTGIRYQGEVIQRKAGKKTAGAAT